MHLYLAYAPPIQQERQSPHPGHEPLLIFLSGQSPLWLCPLRARSVRGRRWLSARPQETGREASPPISRRRSRRPGRVPRGVARVAQSEPRAPSSPRRSASTSRPATARKPQARSGRGWSIAALDGGGGRGVEPPRRLVVVIVRQIRADDDQRLRPAPQPCPRPRRPARGAARRPAAEPGEARAAFAGTAARPRARARARAERQPRPDKRQLADRRQRVAIDRHAAERRLEGIGRRHSDAAHRT